MENNINTIARFVLIVFSYKASYCINIILEQIGMLELKYYSCNRKIGGNNINTNLPIVLILFSYKP